MSPIEFRLLTKLMENTGHVLPRNLLLDHIWGTDVFINERTVDVHIAKLRTRLKDTSASGAIQTIRGLGYSFVCEQAGASSYRRGHTADCHFAFALRLSGM